MLFSAEQVIVSFYGRDIVQNGRVANNVSSYGRDMVQNGLGFMHSVSLKSLGAVLLSMKLHVLPYPVNHAVSRRHSTS